MLLSLEDEKINGRESALRLNSIYGDAKVNASSIIILKCQVDKLYTHVSALCLFSSELLTDQLERISVMTKALHLFLKHL